MLKKNKKLIVILLILIIVFPNVIQAVESTHKYELKKVNNTNVNVVTIDLKDEGYSYEVVTANDKRIGDESFYQMIKRKKPLVAINANYFDAYKTKVPYGSIIKNGKIINLEGNDSVLLVNDKNEVKIESSSIIINGYTDGKKKNEYDVKTDKMNFHTFNIWYVNTEVIDSSGVYLFTNENKNEYKFNKSGTAIIVKDGKVLNIIKNPNNIKLDDNSYIIYYGKDAAKDDYIHARFKKGIRVDLEYQLNRKDEQISADGKINQLISAGPLLVENNKVVYNNKDTKRAQRSAIGITEDNKLILVTKSNLSYLELANIMKSLGCKDAMNLDGGASSALFYNNRYITKPGRKLNTVFMIYN